jgi:hypothetical protein
LSLAPLAAMDTMVAARHLRRAFSSVPSADRWLATVEGR